MTCRPATRRRRAGDDRDGCVREWDGARHRHKGDALCRDRCVDRHEPLREGHHVARRGVCHASLDGVSSTGASITVGGVCWTHVHPELMDVLDFSYWATCTKATRSPRRMGDATPSPPPQSSAASASTSRASPHEPVQEQRQVHGAPRPPWGLRRLCKPADERTSRRGRGALGRSA